MAIRKYSAKEAINRILRLLGSTKNPTSDQPETLQPPVYSEDEALSRIAELIASSLDGVTANVPSAFVATVAEANAGAVNDKVLTPASHSWAHEYGGIYVASGTVVQSLTQNTWNKITGAFQGFMLDSGAEITCDWNDDRIVVNEVGTYFVFYQLSILTPDGGLQNLEVQPYVNGVQQTQIRSKIRFDVSGSMVSMSGGGMVSVGVIGYAIDLRANPDANIDITVERGQLTVEKQNG